MSNASFVVLAVIERLATVDPILGTHQDFIDSFAVHVLYRIRQIV